MSAVTIHPAEAMQVPTGKAVLEGETGAEAIREWGALLIWLRMFEGADGWDEAEHRVMPDGRVEVRVVGGWCEAKPGDWIVRVGDVFQVARPTNRIGEGVGS